MTTTENEDTKTDVSGETNDKVDSTGGEGADTSTNNNQQKETTSQVDIDRIVKNAKNDAKAAAKRDFEKTLEGKQVLTVDEVEQLRRDAIEAYKKEQTLVTVKNSIKAEYGLNDAQVARLTGDDEETLKQDAETLFGALKGKKPPVLLTGNNGGETNTEDTDTNDVNSWLKNDLKKRGYSY